MYFSYAQTNTEKSMVCMYYSCDAPVCVQVPVDLHPKSMLTFNTSYQLRLEAGLMVTHVADASKCVLNLVQDSILFNKNCMRPIAYNKADAFSFSIHRELRLTGRELYLIINNDLFFISSTCYSTSTTIDI